MRPDELENRLQARLDASGPAPRCELLHVLMLPDLDRADRIGEFWSYPESRTFAELLIDCEEDGRCGPCLSGCCGRWSGLPIFERFYPSLYTSGIPHASMGRWKPSQDRSP
jgi:hypothetical protein